MYSLTESKVLAAPPPFPQLGAYMQLLRTIMCPRNSARQLLWCFQPVWINEMPNSFSKEDTSCPAHQLAVLAKQTYTAHGSKKCPTPTLHAVTRCG